MRDTAGKLADRIELLRFEKLRQRLFAFPRSLLDPLFQLFVERAELQRRRFELGRPVRHAALELAVKLFQLPCLAVEFREHLDLRPQYLGHHRHGNVVDRAGRISAQTVEVSNLHSGNKNDRRLFEPRMLPDHPREFKSVQLRHTNIDQHNGDFRAQQMFQRLPGRVGLQEIFAKFPEDYFIAEKLSRLVIDHQDIDLGLAVFVAQGINPVISDVATSAARTGADRYSPAWQGSRRHQPPGTFRDRPSSPWRSAQ